MCLQTGVEPSFSHRGGCREVSDRPQQLLDVARVSGRPWMEPLSAATAWAAAHPVRFAGAATGGSGWHPRAADSCGMQSSGSLADRYWQRLSFFLCLDVLPRSHTSRPFRVACRRTRPACSTPSRRLVDAVAATTDLEDESATTGDHLGSA